MKQSQHMTSHWAFSIGIMAKILLLCILVSGCTVFTGSPTLPAYQSTVAATLLQKYSQSDAIPTDSEKLTVDQRNRIMEDLIFLVDVNYHQFENQFYLGRASFDTATDLAIIALGAAGALVNVSSTQALLAAISGGIGGTRVSINKNFFREQSINALIATMRATRKSKLDFMRDAQSLNRSDYPMSRALVDIGDYYNAGTIVGALGNIVSEAGKKEQAADSNIQKKVQDKIYKTGPLRERVVSWLDKDPKNNVPAFNKWLRSKTPPVSISSVFWVRDTTETELLDAILYFKIPK
jgi:hypothetical protein